MKSNAIALLLSGIGAGVLGGSARGGVAYVTNFNPGTISRIPNGGGAATTFATGLTRPEGIAIGPTGTIYVDNQLSGEIDAVSATGAVTPFVTISTAGNHGVGGLIADGAGNLYVSFQTGNVVDKVTPSGVISTYATGVGNPQGLALDLAGDLFVCDFNNGRVYKVAPGGGAATIFASLPTPTGVATDAAGNVYAASVNGGYVEKFTSAGADLGKYGSMASPWGIRFDDSGALLVASSDSSGSGTVVFSVAPGGGAVTTYSTGLSGPYYIATAVPEPASCGFVVLGTFVGLSTRRRKATRPRGAGSRNRPAEWVHPVPIFCWVGYARLL